MALPKPTVSPAILCALHRIHRQLADLQDRLSQGPRRIRAVEGGVVQRQKELTEAQAELKRLRMLADQKQLNLKSGEAKVKELKAKLNAAASNREYQAFKDQIAADEMANSVLADEVLEALEQIDKCHAKVAESEKVLAATQKRVAEIQTEVQKFEPGIKSDIARLEAELKQTESSLPPDVADLYLRLARQKGEDALAAIEHEVCGGCSTHIPINVVSQVMMGVPMFCKSCGRLLYTPEKAEK